MVVWERLSDSIENDDEKVHEDGKHDLEIISSIQEESHVDQNESSQNKEQFLESLPSVSQFDASVQWSVHLFVGWIVQPLARDDQTL